MPLENAYASVRVKARRTAGKALRSSPAPVQDAVQRARTKVSAARQARVERKRWAKGTLVWQTPPVPLPDGLTFEEIEQTFRSWSVNGEPVGHMNDYVTDSKLRFLYTWGLVRDDSGSCLELGGNPYFTTWLLEQHSKLDLSLANYYGERGETTETVSWLPPGASERVEVARHSQMFNVEEDEFPYQDDSFDVVLFCEMIEHMLMDPLATLRQIHRVLKPNGVLILTTPNVARIENVLRLLSGANLYDPYSGYGPYGRHNREYNRHELHRLLDFAGFEVETSFTADGHPSDATKWEFYDDAAPLIEYRKADLGHYLYIRARASRAPREGLPSFLYRSWPEGKIVRFD
ncbi:class I SAM-dependent methyltransferase [Jatrophihabitans sp. DSM 45814]